jgi:hypothetical protein
VGNRSIIKTNITSWRTIDHSNYTFAINGGPPQSAEHILKVGLTTPS